MCFSLDGTRLEFNHRVNTDLCRNHLLIMAECMHAESASLNPITPPLSVSAGRLRWSSGVWGSAVGSGFLGL